MARAKAFVAVTDGDWFAELSVPPVLDEVNFWQPSGRTLFRALLPGELFLFKLHRPRDFIVGGGFFTHATLLPVRLAWETFGRANGAQSIEQMRTRIERYRHRAVDPDADSVGCILLARPFFLPNDLWIPSPPDWKPNIVRGRGYDLTVEPGRTLWNQVQAALRFELEEPTAAIGADAPRFGRPVVVLPRLGQGTFQVLVTDAYQRRCAVTRERTLPALEAAHIRPYAEGGEHRVDNGLLLRRDVHVLFDRGYLTVTPERRVEVSRRIREEFENGRDYYALQGRELQDPSHAAWRPDPAFLRWHNENRYRG